MVGIEGDKPIDPQMKEVFRQECTQGVELFQKSLKAYQKTEDASQREEYKQVMDEAMKLIQQTAAQCLGKELEKSELQKDYNQFMEKPSEANLGKLNGDLEQIKKDVS